MRIKRTISLTITLVALVGMSLIISGRQSRAQDDPTRALQAQSPDPQISNNAQRMIEEGMNTFRFDTFGDEAFWGDALQLHRAIAGSQFGGVGPGLSPRAALGLGLKVDQDAIPLSLVRDLQRGRVNLDDPAITLALLRLNAVVGVKGFFNEGGGLRSVGIS